MTAVDSTMVAARTDARSDEGPLGHDAAIWWPGGPAMAAVVQAMVQTSARAVGLASDHGAAAIMCATIYGRGVRSLGDAAMRMVLMSWEDHQASVRAMIRSLAARPGAREALRMELDLARLRSSRTMARNVVLTTMTMQVLEEATYPLVRRADAAFEHLAETTSA